MNEPRQRRATIWRAHDWSRPSRRFETRQRNRMAANSSNIVSA
jgi:hypothetical protein